MKVTVGLASHWPCVTDFSGLSTYGLKCHAKGDEHPTYALDGVWSSLHFITSVHAPQLYQVVSVTQRYHQSQLLASILHF